MRVLHIIDSLNMGGAETWLVELVKYRATHNISMPAFDFLAAGGEPAIFDDLVRQHGCRIFYLPLRKGKTIDFIKGLRRILRENSYAAIHDHQDFLAGWHFLFGLGYLPPVRAVHFHNPFYQTIHNYGVTAGRRLKQRMGRYFVKWFSTDIYGTSSKILREYAVFPDHFRRQRVLPVHCAFNISRFSGEHDVNKRRLCTSLGWPADTKIVLFAGRLDQSTQLGHPNNHKNSAFALEVLYAINDPSVRMVMAGANHYVLEPFQALINEKNLVDRVKLLGVRSDMAHLMLAADVLLFPSRAEGMGMVAVEAQAAGLPVIASSMVPDEIVVIPELVAFKDLEDPFPFWAETLLQMLARRTPQSTENDARWSLSGFNIEVCCRQLTQLYLPQSQVV